MTRWFRFYGDVIHDPKILKLPEVTRWRWMAVLCAASKCEGIIPPADDLALMLRITMQETLELIRTLETAKLIVTTDTGYEPHNWAGRQYKTDAADPTAPARNKRYRDKKRAERTDAPGVAADDDRNARIATVSPIRPDSDSEPEAESEISDADASGAKAPRDYRSDLFTIGLKRLAAITGKGPDACRSFVGKCLKAAGDDAVVVLGLIEDAERNQVINPTAWIAARLKPVEIGNAKTQTGSLIASIRDDLARSIEEDNHPARDGAPVLLISTRSV